MNSGFPGVRDHVINMLVEQGFPFAEGPNELQRAAALINNGSEQIKSHVPPWQWVQLPVAHRTGEIALVR